MECKEEEGIRARHHALRRHGEAAGLFNHGDEFVERFENMEHACSTLLFLWSLLVCRIPLVFGGKRDGVSLDLHTLHSFEQFFED